MPQHLQMSPKPPEAQNVQRSQRERELRVQGDAGAFGMLLGALQGGESGIVRGEARNDSAAEWNAQDAQKGRQETREGAQPPTPRAQESREGLEKLAGASRQQVGQQTPASRAGDEAIEAPVPNKGEARGKTQNAAPKGDEPMKQGDQRPAPVANPAQARAQAVPAPASVATGAVAAQASASGTNQNSQATAIGAARGPQSGAARGKAPEVATPRGDRALRFERVFEAQVGRGLAQALRSGTGEVTLRLRPQNLGQLSVRVQVENSRVTATFEAHSAEAQRMIEGSRDSLRQQLEMRGLSVERIDVKLVEDGSQAGTRLAVRPDGGADGGQDGRAFAGDREGRGAPDGGGADDGSRRGATREDDEPAARAEPWRAMGTVRLDATA
ncbi:MAG: flagellar hook-length control protein FliK [Phycisphaera sp.]|nr:MAG: flagellar hook-length control protein FliK [Phycisphaera sp.]